MKRSIPKIFRLNFSEKVLAVLAILLLAAMLLPIVRLALFSVPWYDDYSYALYVRSFIRQDGIFLGAVKGAAYVVKTWWWCWQGTFSSIFMMSLMPEAFGEGLYPVGIIGIIIFFTIASMTAVIVICGKVLHASRSVQLMTAVLISLTMIELIYTAQQGIFWYNAAVHYTFMHGCMMLLLAASIKVLYAEKKSKIFLYGLAAMFLALVCSGSNYVTALQGALLLLVVIILGAVYRNLKGLYLLPAFGIYAAGLYLNISAPGNAIRGASYQGFGAVKSVLLSLKSGAIHFWEFTGFITIIILVVYVLMLWNTISKMDFGFPLPGVITLFSFGFYCTGFTSSYYGMGTEGLSRTWVVVKFTLQLLLFFNVAYWMGWFMQQFKRRGQQIPQVKQWIWVYALAGCFAALWLVTNSNQAGSFASYGAYYYVHTGEAANLHNEYQQRTELIKNSSEDVVGVDPYIWKPWFLYRGELSSNPSAEPNKAMASWFEKSGIYLKE